MGLDQWAYAQAKNGERTELHYWRKHPNLHGWMENIWRERNPDIKEDFNCFCFELSKKDIDKLKKDIENKRLPMTRGFFFGESDEEQIYDDLDFISKAKRRMKEGYKIFYYSWW